MSKPYETHLFPVQPWELQASQAAGITISQLRFTTSFFLSVLVAVVLRKLPNAKSRHWFSALSGFLLLYYPFGPGVLHALVTSTLTYLFMLLFRQHCGTLTWLVVFPYLILCHILSASGTAWKEGNLDFTGAQMVATLKLIATAMCYQDGLRLAEEVQGASAGAGTSGDGSEHMQTPPTEQQGGASSSTSAGGASVPAGSGSKGPGKGLGSYSRAKALDTLPSPLEFVSYVFAAGNLLAGPFFEARDYFDYVERKGDWDERDPQKRIPSPLLPGLARLLKGIFFMALWAHLSASYSPDLMEGAWWGTLPVWRRIVMMWVIGFVSRCKYYFAWGVAESGLIFSSLCFNGYSEGARGKPQPQWTRYINSRIRRVELSTSCTDLVQSWNIATGTWLRYYVYERLTPPGRRPTFRTVVATQMVSGIWHGLFPGYWLFFVSSAFLLESSKVLYRYEMGWPPALRHSPLWIVVKVLYSAFTLNYCAAAFQILTWKESIAAWRSVYFSGHILMLLVLLVGAVLPPRRPRSVKPQRASDAAAGAAAAAAGPGTGGGGSREGGAKQQEDGAAAGGQEGRPLKVE